MNSHIRIGATNDFTGCGARTAVSRGGDRSLFDSDDPATVCSGNRGCLIGRYIVRNDEFDRFRAKDKSLTSDCDRIKQSRQQFLFVVGGNDE